MFDAGRIRLCLEEPGCFGAFHRRKISADTNFWSGGIRSIGVLEARGTWISLFAFGRLSARVAGTAAVSV